MTVRRFIPALLIVAAMLVAYAPVLRNSFVDWDDPQTIRDNPRLNPPSIEGTVHYWKQPADGLYVPLTYTVWSAIAVVARRGDGAMNPVFYHAASVALHAGAALLVYAILRRLTLAPAAACVGAMLFALHPVQVEAVAWASGLKDVLAGSLALATILLYLSFASAKPDDRRRVVYYVAAVVTFAAACLAKPSAAVAPVIAGVLDVVLVRRPLRDAARSLLPMLVLAVPVVVVARAVQIVWDPTRTPVWARPLIAGDALAFYLYKLLWPVGLTTFYGRTPHSVLESRWTYVVWVVPVLVALVILLNRKRMPMPWLLAGGAVFVIGLLPVLGFTPFMYQLHSTVADHYMYLPMFGVALAAAGAVEKYQTRGVLIGAGLVLALLGGLSIRQSLTWKDDLTLSNRGVALYPRSRDAHASLARALASAGRVGDAVPHFRFVAEAAPESLLAQRNLAQALVFAGRYPEALGPAQAALDLAMKEGAADTAWEHFLLGKALAGAGQFDDADVHLALAAQQRPSDPLFAAERDTAREKARLASPTTRQ